MKKNNSNKTRKFSRKNLSRNVILDERQTYMKDTLQFFLMPLFWFSPSEITMNMETIIIFASYISGLSVGFPFKHRMP